MYVGDSGIGINPRLAQRYREADLLLVAGARLGESTTSGYTLVDMPVPQLPLVHAYPGSGGARPHLLPDAADRDGMPQLAAALRALEPVDGSRFAEWTESARADFVANQEPPPAAGDGVDMTEVVQRPRATCCPTTPSSRTARATSRSGSHRFYTYRDYRTQLAPTSGSMGYGLPAAIAAKLAAPEREVVCLAGDG